MYEAYIDETGTHYKGAICAVAGFLSTPDRWNVLRKEWRKVCDQHPKTPDFHAYDAHNLQGDYWGWMQDQSLTIEELAVRRDTRLMDLVAVIRAHCMRALTVAIDMAAYRRVVAPRFPHQPNAAYFIMFWHIQFGITKWMVENKVDEQIQFVFDDFSVFGRNSASWHSTMLSDPGLPAEAVKILQPLPRFAHDKDEPALKAADLFAWHMQRDVNTMAKAGAAWRPEMRTKPFSALKEVPPLGQLLADKELEELLPLMEKAKL